MLDTDSHLNRARRTVALALGAVMATAAAAALPAVADARFPSTAVYADNGTYTVTVTLRQVTGSRRSGPARLSVRGLLLGDGPGQRSRLELTSSCRPGARGVVLGAWDLDNDGFSRTATVPARLATPRANLRLSSFQGGGWDTAGCLDLRAPRARDAGFAGQIGPTGDLRARGLAIFGLGDTGTHEVGHFLGILGAPPGASFQVASGGSCSGQPTQIYNDTPVAVSDQGTITPDIRKVDLDGDRAFGLVYNGHAGWAVCGRLSPVARVTPWATFPSD